MAKVIDIMVTLGLSIEDRFALAMRVEHAEDFSSLPEADRRAILAAEKIAQAGLSMADIMNMAREPGKEYN